MWRWLLLVCVWTGCGDARVGGDGSVPPSDGGTASDGSMPASDGGGRDAGQTMPTSPLVDPDCVDGQYTETLPDPSIPIADLSASFTTAQAVTFMDGALGRRYPFGQTLAREGQEGFIDCVATFLRDRSSPDAVIGEVATVVHECGHVYDDTLSSGQSNTYAIRAGLLLTGARGDSTDRGGLTFARSRIRNDDYQSRRAPCPPDSFIGCDSYANIYLDGDPDDGTFDSGDQGFNLLFDEVVQYVNSLATAYAFSGELSRTGFSVSERDGILNFLWYMERYLRMARLDFPSAYQHLVTGDGGNWRRAILTVWGRAWLYLDVTEGMSALGIDDDALMTLVTDADLLAEIQLLRDAEGCPAP